MKRYLLLLLGIMIATIVMAADVITKKNGTTIQCQVIKVGRTEVEYRNIKNLNGPVYAIDLTEISSIKYENGGTDKFGEQSVITTNTGQRTLTDGELMRMYNKMDMHPGRGLKIGGIIVAGIGLAAITVAGVSTEGFGYWDDHMSKGAEMGFLGVGIVGLCSGGVMYYLGHRKSEERFGYTPFFQQDFQLGNNALLTADVNMINDNITHDKSLGMGLRFTF